MLQMLKKIQKAPKNAGKFNKPGKGQKTQQIK
jgi:hypothetical protein